MFGFCNLCVIQSKVSKDGVFKRCSLYVGQINSSNSPVFVCMNMLEPTVHDWSVKNIKSRPARGNSLLISMLPLNHDGLKHIICSNIINFSCDFGHISSLIPALLTAKSAIT